jgi:putative flippase GtrA
MYKKVISMRVIRFLVSGGSAAVTEYGVFLFLFDLVKIDVVIANGISFLCGLMVSFLLNKHWVFKSKQRARMEVVLYVILALVNLLLSSLFIQLLVHTAGISPFIAKLIGMVVIAAWNYLFFSRLIFKQR